MKKSPFQLLSLGLLLALALQLAGGFKGINEALNSALPLIDTPWMNLLTALGGNAFLALFAIIVVLSELKKLGGVSSKTLAFLIALSLGLVAVGALKALLAEPRPRPLPGAGFLSSGAFPSGHTFRAAVIASYVSDRWKKLAPLAWAYAIGVALTRLFLHYHWLSDVLFSLLFAPWLYLLLRSTEKLWLPIMGRILKKLNLEVVEA
ncbi:phosphatase PAP2 family protein [Thermococcus sp.]|uniref:phosphatase PAP2 family protein n=1 Tax=Thermococcus sp. TaxID=35749 RepID=UPI002622E4BA|nr:phosphatase PAP2 family protein [Thermococcus sp.]